MNVPSMDNASLYKTYKNKLNHTLRLAKRLYFKKKLEDVKSNTHATWKILNEILNRKKVKDSRKLQLSFSFCNFRFILSVVMFSFFSYFFLMSSYKTKAEET